MVLNLLGCQGTLCCTGPHGLTALHVIMPELASAPQGQSTLISYGSNLIKGNKDFNYSNLHRQSANLFECLISLYAKRVVYA